MIDVEVYMDYVIILGVRIDRPSRIARSQWYAWWKR